MIGANRNVKATVLVVRLREEIGHTQHKQHNIFSENTYAQDYLQKKYLQEAK